jgi:DNA polymerase III alpha subunit
MIKDKFGQIVLNEDDIVNLLMQKKSINYSKTILVGQENLLNASAVIEIPIFKTKENQDISVDTFDCQQQNNWLMPDKYKNFDIAAYILSLCQNDAELQRCGQELLMYQERNLFDLLKYLHYLVQTMKDNSIIWGVGRGSSVASFVLYKLGVHRVDSLFYELDPNEFLR